MCWAKELEDHDTMSPWIKARKDAEGDEQQLKRDEIMYFEAARSESVQLMKHKMPLHLASKTVF
jgi:hypothetical protein